MLGRSTTTTWTRRDNHPTPNPYTIVLQACLRSNRELKNPVIVGGAEVHDPVSLMCNIVVPGCLGSQAL